jgi:hypothetical protein
LTEQAADAAIDTACRLLRLPSIRNEFSEIADRAVKDQMTYRGFLAELLMTGCHDRARRRSERRIKAAGFPWEKSLRAFDFDANPNIDAATVHTLASCEWIKKSQPLCLIGDSGTGKSHMLIALGTEAAMKGYRVRYTLATKLVNELVEAAETCVVHLLGNSFRYAARQDWEKIAKALRPVHTAPTEDAALERFVEFTDAWGGKYPAIVRLWEAAWAEFVPFLQFDVEIRKIVCTTNAIESINARIRKAVRARGHFPTDRPPSNVSTWPS